MKKIIYVLLTIALVSCKKDPSLTTAPTVTVVDNDNEIHTEWYGSWVGDFEAEEYDQNKDIVYVNKINISIKKITDNNVIAQSIVAGNSRSLSGSFTESEAQDRFVLTEPGDNKYDGKFTFDIVSDTLSGTWTANDKSLPVTKRSFKLVKKQFAYYPQLMLPDEGDYVDRYNPKMEKTAVTEDGETYNEALFRQASESVRTINASTEVLQEEQLKNLKKIDLEIIRNTIFARHGYTFKKKSVRQFFDPVDWYVPVSEDVSGDLTKLEKDNIVLLKRFEKYAEDNYDSFGR